MSTLTATREKAHIQTIDIPPEDARQSPELQEKITYPDSDGKPMADNTKQFEWIVTIKEGLELLFADDPNVFMAGDLLWYQVKGDNKTRVAPDVLVAFGRPKGHRGSYRTWEEDDIVPQVVFEILSPGNIRKEMEEKLRFYDRYGVEEYYLYDPDDIELKGWIRSGIRLKAIAEMQSWKSPRLGIRFEIVENDLHLFRPDGEEIRPPVEIGKDRQVVRQRAANAEQRAANAEQHAAAAEQRAEQLAAQLRESGLKVD